MPTTTPAGPTTNLSPSASRRVQLPAGVAFKLRAFADWFGHPGAVVAGFAALVGGAAHLVTQNLTPACASPPVPIVRLELAFYATRLAELLSAEQACRVPVIESFLWDSLFALAYAGLLAFAFIWVERWRRYPDGVSEPGDITRVRRRDSFFINAALAAGLFDILENGFIWSVADSLEGTPAGGVTLFAKVMVAVGSIASAIKWLLIVLWVWGFTAELLSGPRGAILRRARFSFLATAVTLPLLVIPQGQDILRRLSEGEHPFYRAILNVAVVGAAAWAVWRCARTLVQFEIKDPRWEDGAWRESFGKIIPRLLGIGVLAIVGAAFARESGNIGYYLAGGALGLVPFAFTDQLVKYGTAHKLDERKILGVALFKNEPRIHIVGAAIAVVIAALVIFHFRLPFPLPTPTSPEQSRLALDAASWYCVVAAWGLYVYTRFRRRWALESATIDQEALDELRNEYSFWELTRRPPRRVIKRTMLAVAFSAIVLVAFALWPVGIGRALGSLGVLSVFVANIVLFGSIAVWIGLRYEIPIVRIAIVIAFICSIWNENHSVRRVDPPTPTALSERKPLEGHLAEWLQARVTPRDSSPAIVLVSAAGGGLRAAYWAAITLAELQDHDSTFANKVFAIVGVSGGSLGGALFTAIVHDAAQSPGVLDSCAPRPADPAGIERWRHSRYATCIRNYLADDYLSPALAKMLGPDLAQRFWPVSIAAADRSEGLEGAWSGSYTKHTKQNTFEQGLLRLYADSTTRIRLPMLIMNATHVETGRRYIASPMLPSSEFQNVGDVFAAVQGDVPVVSAVHNSARFTYISPAGHLESPSHHDAGRVVDGGYFENSGLTTAREAYEAIHAYAPQLEPIVIYLCNNPGPCAHPDSVGQVQTWANDLLAPIRTLLHESSGHEALAEDEIVAKVGRQRFIQFNVCVPSAKSGAEAARRDRVLSPPLGWVLSRMTRAWMDSSIATLDTLSDDKCRVNNQNALHRLDSLLAPHSP